MTNADKKMVPELRFKGYTDDWDQRLLSNFMTFSNGINAPKESYGNGRKMISVMDILDNQKINYDDIRNSVKVDKRIEDKNMVENGDLIFVRSSEIAKEVGLTKAYLEDRYALYSGFTIRGKKQKKFNSYFMELELNYSCRKQIERKAGGSTRFNISQEILNNIEILIPKIEEQNKISDLFSNIENTTALHQSKLEKLKELKNGLLQQMFPQKDEKVPKLRFANFEGDWETKKFKEIWRRTSNKNKDLKYDESKIISVAKMTDIFKQNNTNEEYLKTYNILKKGDIAFEGNKSKNYLFGRFVLNDFRDGIVSHVFITFTPIVEMDDSFMKEYINNGSVAKF